MSIKKTNGVSPLNNELEEMRLSVVGLELKARYWKAQYEIRSYTLAADKIQDEYNEHVSKQRGEAEKMRKEFEDAMEKLSKEQTVEIEEKENV